MPPEGSGGDSIVVEVGEADVLRPKPFTHSDTCYVCLGSLSSGANAGAAEVEGFRCHEHRSLFHRKCLEEVRVHCYHCRTDVQSLGETAPCLLVLLAMMKQKLVREVQLRGLAFVTSLCLAGEAYTHALLEAGACKWTTELIITYKVQGDREVISAALEAIIALASLKYSGRDNLVSCGTPAIICSVLSGWPRDKGLAARGLTAMSKLLRMDRSVAHALHRSDASHVIVEALERHKDDRSVLAHGVEAISLLHVPGSRTLIEAGGMRALCDVMRRSAHDADMQTLCSQALCVMAQDERSCEGINEAGGAAALVKVCTSHTTNSRLTMLAATAIERLARKSAQCRSRLVRLEAGDALHKVMSAHPSDTATTGKGLRAMAALATDPAFNFDYTTVHRYLSGPGLEQHPELAVESLRTIHTLSTRSAAHRAKFNQMGTRELVQAAMAAHPHHAALQAEAAQALASLDLTTLDEQEEEATDDASAGQRATARRSIDGKTSGKHNGRAKTPADGGPRRATVEGLADQQSSELGSSSTSRMRSGRGGGGHGEEGGHGGEGDYHPLAGGREGEEQEETDGFSMEGFPDEQDGGTPLAGGGGGGGPGTPPRHGGGQRPATALDASSLPSSARRQSLSSSMGSARRPSTSTAVRGGGGGMPLTASLDGTARRLSSTTNIEDHSARRSIDGRPGEHGGASAIRSSRGSLDATSRGSARRPTTSSDRSSGLGSTAELAGGRRMSVRRSDSGGGGLAHSSSSSSSSSSTGGRLHTSRRTSTSAATGSSGGQATTSSEAAGGAQGPPQRGSISRQGSEGRGPGQLQRSGSGRHRSVGQRQGSGKTLGSSKRLLLPPTGAAGEGEEGQKQHHEAGAAEGSAEVDEKQLVLEASMQAANNLVRVAQQVNELVVELDGMGDGQAVAHDKIVATMARAEQVKSTAQDMLRLFVAILCRGRKHRPGDDSQLGQLAGRLERGEVGEEELGQLLGELDDRVGATAKRALAVVNVCRSLIDSLARLAGMRKQGSHGRGAAQRMLSEGEEEGSGRALLRQAKESIRATLLTAKRLIQAAQELLESAQELLSPDNAEWAGEAVLGLGRRAEEMVRASEALLVGIMMDSDKEHGEKQHADKQHQPHAKPHPHQAVPEPDPQPAVQKPFASSLRRGSASEPTPSSNRRGSKGKLNHAMTSTGGHLQQAEGHVGAPLDSGNHLSSRRLSSSLKVLPHLTLTGSHVDEGLVGGHITIHDLMVVAKEPIATTVRKSSAQLDHSQQLLDIMAGINRRLSASMRSGSGKVLATGDLVTVSEEATASEQDRYEKHHQHQQEEDQQEEAAESEPQELGGGEAVHDGPAGKGKEEDCQAARGQEQQKAVSEQQPLLPLIVQAS